MTTSMSLIYFAFELAAALIATFTYSKYKDTPLKYALPLLWLAFIIETSATLYYHYVYPNNHWIFSLYNLLYYILFFKMFYEYSLRSSSKRFIKVSGMIGICAILIEACFYPLLDHHITHSSNLCTIIFIAQALIVAIDILKSKLIIDIKKSPAPFFIGGYLAFEIVYAPLSIMYDYNIQVWDGAIYTALRTIQFYFLILMYCVFMFGFLWTKPESQLLE